LSNALTDEAYWDDVWRRTAPPEHIHPWKNPVEARLSRFFRRALPRGGRCLEVGCAASVWLPFFAKELGAEPWGVDFSAVGLDIAQRNLSRAGAQGKLVQGDFFKVDLPRNSFRVIYSLGVVEHFEDPTPYFRRSYELLEPGGVAATVIPNMAGMAGKAQRWASARVYDLHRPFTPEQLDRFQTAAGLRARLAPRPLGVFSLGVVNWLEMTAPWPAPARRAWAYGVQYADRLAGWATLWADRALDGLWSSPFLACVYEKP